ncbi:MAG: hypothetical protein M3463_01775 [Verrucomicrobiota bacterium]|nr:hypothetical protein [Verrucomicrobiota bacterium]
MNPELDALRSLEDRYAKKVEHYNHLLNGVRELIVAETGTTEVIPGTAPISSPSQVTATEASANGRFVGMTKGEAVETLLRENGEMKAADLFNEMKQGGHPVASRESLMSLLSGKKDRFISKGRGVWALKQLDLPVNGQERRTGETL